MPVVTMREPFTPSTFNTRQAVGPAASELFGAHFGPDRVVETKPVMGGEDFSRFWLADKTKRER